MARNLMIQGTMSGVGKSILTAGILRILHRRGYKVAPFKSQNMALNSFVTRNGREIGRAQALQAYAAGIEPCSDMNPILLKPMGESMSQVIVNGLPVENMRALDYFKKKTLFLPDIKRAYDNLSREADIIVIEGAGSPVEINLRENDIVNMGLANLLDAPVLLVGNIDPGGVFAQLLGTVNLLGKEERERIKGLIINKFRGDRALLEPGLSMFGEYCDIPFAGVVPYTELSLDEEDSVSDRLTVDNSGFKGSCGREIKVVSIAVIRLPFISNYTDFSALEVPGYTDLRYVDDPAGLAGADLVIIPGTKNTLEDLKWLKESGLSDCIMEHAAAGRAVIGICGGFQMLGTGISDPGAREGGGEARGLSLLPLRTVFEEGKHLKQTEGEIGKLQGLFEPLSGIHVSGYEIHIGESTSESEIFPVAAKGPVLGTYIHGIFDCTEFTKKLIEIILKNKGISSSLPQFENVKLRREKELDKLADVLRDNLDMEMIYRIIGI